MVGDVTTLERDCQAIIVPGGHTMTLPAGTRVTVLESQPAGVKVKISSHGSIAVITRADAAALGLAAALPEPNATAAAPAASSVEEAVWSRLRTCFDPEIPVNIVELGLVYGCRIETGPGGAFVTVDLTLTAPGCSMADVLKDQIESKLRAIEGVTGAEVKLVMEPPWDPSRMSDAARLELGLF